MAGKYKDIVKVASGGVPKWVYADLHLSHGQSGRDDKGILKHTDRKEFFKDVNEMTDYIVETHNQIVSRKDEVIIIGDYAFRYHNKFLNAMNGKKILVAGDHDEMPVHVIQNMFAGYYPILTRKIGGQQVTFSHWPMLTWPKSYYGTWNLHGHCHGRLRESFKSLRVDMSWDVWMRPIPFDLVGKKMEMKKNKGFSIDYPDSNGDIELNDNARALAKANLNLMLDFFGEDINIDSRILEFYGVKNG